MHERAQTMGREGPGGGALDMLVGTPNINAAKNGKTSWSYVICYAVRFDVNCNVIWCALTQCNRKPFRTLHRGGIWFLIMISSCGDWRLMLITWCDVLSATVPHSTYEKSKVTIFVIQSKGLRDKKRSTAQHNNWNAMLPLLFDSVIHIKSHLNTISAAASTAKVVLAAAGVKASTLSKKTSVSIGGLNIPLKRTDLIPAVLPPQTVVKKQSFVSSSSSTMIFDMSVLAAPNTHTNNSTSGRRNSVTSTQRSARSRMDTLLSNCPSADNTDSNSSKSVPNIVALYYIIFSIYQSIRISFKWLFSTLNFLTNSVSSFTINPIKILFWSWTSTAYRRILYLIFNI